MSEPRTNECLYTCTSVRTCVRSTYCVLFAFVIQFKFSVLRIPHTYPWSNSTFETFSRGQVVFFCTRVHCYSKKGRLSLGCSGRETSCFSAEVTAVTCLVFEQGCQCVKCSLFKHTFKIYYQGYRAPWS